MLDRLYLTNPIPFESKSGAMASGGETPLSILKGYAKTLFNKFSGNTTPPLTPLEQAKFDAAQSMMRDGKTTRYAYYKYKKEFEQPILNTYKNILETHPAIQTGKHPLYDESLRKLAGFIDKLDQKKLSELQKSQEKYADFISEAFMIANVNVGRSKSKRIADALDAAITKTASKPETAHIAIDLKKQPEEHNDDSQIIDLNKDNLLALIEHNIDFSLCREKITQDIDTMARKLHPLIKTLTGIIKSMSPEDRKADQISDRCFYLLGDFIGMNSSNQRAINTTSDMLRFMTACFTDHMPEMIADLKVAEQSNNQFDFLKKYAPVMIKTYQFLVPTGYLTSGSAKIDEDNFIAFINDIEGEFKAAYNKAAHSKKMPTPYICQQ